MSPLRQEWFADNFVMVHTHLVRAMGGDAAGALVVGAIRFRMNNFGEEIDGQRWWRGSYSELEGLTGLSVDQIQRTVTRLRGEYIVTEKHRLGGSWDHTLSYRLAWAEGHAPDDAVPRKRSSDAASSSSRDSASSSFLQEEVQEEPPTPLPGPPPAPPVTDTRSVKDDDGFEDFWQAFPRKERQVVTRAAYRHALESTDPDTLLRGAKGYARKITRDGTEPRYIQTADRWLREERWTDDYRAPRAEQPWWAVAD